jgi:hypothetical protein
MDCSGNTGFVRQLLMGKFCAVIEIKANYTTWDENNKVLVLRRMQLEGVSGLDDSFNKLIIISILICITFYNYIRYYILCNYIRNW